MDSKSLITGRENTVNGWATYENAVTESVYESTGEVDISPFKGSHGPWRIP